MRGDDDRRAQAMQFHEQPQEPACQARIDIACRLVRDQEFRLGDQGPRNGGALLFAAGKHRRQHMHAVTEADPLQELDHFGTVVRLGSTLDAHRERDILEGREMVEKAELLEHHAGLAAHHRQLRLRHARHVGAVHLDDAARRAQRKHDQLEQGRFAGARGPGEKLEGARGDREGEIAQDLGPHPVAHADMLEADHRRGVALHHSSAVNHARRPSEPSSAAE